MTETIYDTSDPAVRARLVEYIALEQEEADAWRAILAVGVGPLVSIAPAGIEAAKTCIAKHMALLADGNRDA